MGTHPSNDAINPKKHKQMSTKQKSAGAQIKDTSKKSKKAQLTKANLESATKKVQENKVSKYAYPDDINTPEKKKAFRRNARAQKSKFDKSLGALKHSHKPEDKQEYAKLFKEQEQWAKKTYAAPEVQ